MEGVKDDRLTEALRNISIIRDELTVKSSSRLNDDERASLLARIATLEDEADLLAVANADLRKEIVSLKERNHFLESKATACATKELDDTGDRNQKDS